jgi:hypothetical protein
MTLLEKERFITRREAVMCLEELGGYVEEGRGDGRGERGEGEERGERGEEDAEKGGKAK